MTWGENKVQGRVVVANLLDMAVRSSASVTKPSLRSCRGHTFGGVIEIVNGGRKVGGVRG